MNLECQVCTGKKIATSFNSLDDLQVHLFMNHHDGPLDVFTFVCHKCEFKFGTEYRLLRHEERCGRESRSEEDMEKIRYKLQMYELLELTLKYNMTKHQISGARPANPSNIGTLETRETQCQTESLGLKEIKSEILESLENPVSNSRRENNVKNRSGPSVISNETTNNFDQNCFIDTATNTQSNVKTEPEDVDTSEVEVLGSVEIRKRKAPSRLAEHISHRSGVSALQNVNSAGESSNLRHAKQAKTSLKEEFRAYFGQYGKISSVTVRKNSYATVTFENCDSVAKCILERTHKILGQDFIIWETTPSESMRDKLVGTGNLSSENASVPNNLFQLTPDSTNRISVTGPLLHPEEIDPKAFQKKEFHAYFGQFGKVIVVSYALQNLEAKVAFDNCDSAAICIQQGTHRICGRDFVVCAETPTQDMKDKISGINGIHHSSWEALRINGFAGRRHMFRESSQTSARIPGNGNKSVTWKASTSQGYQ